MKSVLNLWQLVNEIVKIEYKRRIELQKWMGWNYTFTIGWGTNFLYEKVFIICVKSYECEKYVS